MKAKQSNFGWIDFSAADMKRVKEALAAINSGSVDELGIAIIRDGFADKLFPGLNVLQTSLKYFLLIPAMLKKIELDQRSIIIEEARKDNNENNLFRFIRTLLIDLECKFCDEACKADGDKTNIIGNSTAGRSDIPNEKRLVRFPHDIYWHALYTFGLVKDSTMRAYVSNLKSRFSQKNKYAKEDILKYWENCFQYTPDEFLKVKPEAPLLLTEMEKRFLFDNKIKKAESVKNTLLEKVIDEKFTLSGNRKAEAIANFLKNSKFKSDEAEAAAQFALYMRCAFLGFNVAYFFRDKEKVDKFFDEIVKMKEEIGGKFDLDFLESIAKEFNYQRKKPRVFDEMKKYFQLLNGDFTVEAIKKQMIVWEKAAKGGKAYLEKSNPAGNEDWKGMEYLDFRLETVLKLFGDQYTVSKEISNEQ